MKNIIGVRFKKLGKIYFFNPKGLKVKEGDKVKAGTLLIEFDKYEVEKEYDITSPIIIPNFSELKSLDKTEPRSVSVGDTIMIAVK